MVPLTFSIDGSKLLQIGFFNIHSLGNKLENDTVKEWVLKHDIVLLSETKSDVKFTVSGYKVIYGKTINAHRGGVALLVRNALFKYITDIDVTVIDQIWFRLTSMPSVLFGGCYVTPSDSPYYEENSIANILGKCKENSTMENGSHIIFGDLNARLGKEVNELVRDNPDLTYVPVDNISQPNFNGRKLLDVAKDCDLLVINNLLQCNKSKFFDGGLTFRKGQRWISELDICLISSSRIVAVAELTIDQRLHIPSDHAPISVSYNL